MATKKILWLAPVIFLAACGNGGNTTRNNSSAAAQENVGVADTSVATEHMPINSPERKVIRTADFRCKVKNVLTATTTLEDMVRSVGGIVQDSRIDNNSSGVNSSYYTVDSLRQTEAFTTTATLTLRVPVMYLDSVIHALPGLSSFIDARTLRQNDVTYRYLANELKNHVGDNTNTTARAMELAKKSKEPIEVQEYENNRQEKKIERRMENLQLMDDVTYATVTVAFSQPEQVYMQIVVNPDYYNRTPLLLQYKEALYSGWSFLIAFTAGIINIWPILLMALGGWYMFRKYRNRGLLLARK